MLETNTLDEARVAPLRILVRADADALRCSIDQGLADRIRARTDGAVSAIVDVLPIGRAEALLEQVRANPGIVASADVVLLSLAPELDPDQSGAATRARFQKAMGELIGLFAEAGVYLVVLNGSTIVPDDHTSCYRNGEETPALVMHRLNAALMELAAGEGISILDADRVIAELGGEGHVSGLLAYSDVAQDALCTEFVSILNDSGFLDGRARRAATGNARVGSVLRVEMVADVVAVRAGRVRRWPLAEGASFESGDVIVDVDVTQYANLKRDRNRQHVGPVEERDDELTVGARRRAYFVRVIALEPGVLGKITAPKGTEVAVGDLLGIVQVGDGTDVVTDAPPPGGPTLQTVAVRIVPDRLGLKQGDGTPKDATPKRAAPRGAPPKTSTRAANGSCPSRCAVEAAWCCGAGNECRVGNGALVPERGETVEGETFVRWTQPRACVVRSRREPEPRTGIFLKGACDLPALLFLGELLENDVVGTVGIYKDEGAIAHSRADLLLQALNGVPREQTEELFDRVPLPRSYFEPRFIDPTFRIPGRYSMDEFPKSVIVLSLVPNVIRTMYRHREHGYLVDPGAWWLEDDRLAKGQKERLDWLRAEFSTIGRLTVDEFVELFTKLMLSVRERLDAHVIVFNVLTVEPGLRVHNYRMRKAPDGLRRREFNIALAEMSGPLGFHIVDVDRTLKRYGISRQQDFDHFPVDASLPIATEALRVLRELEVL